MKKILFSLLLITGFAVAANAQSNAKSTDADSQPVITESAAPAQPAAESEKEIQNTNGTAKTGCSEMSGTKKPCCAHGKKTASNSSGVKSDMRKEDKVSD